MPAEVSHAQWKPVTLAEARSLFDQGARFLDARSEEDYNKLHVWWAMHYTPAMDDSLREMLKLAMVTHQKIVVYGRETSFWPAAIIAQRLRNMGFQDVYVMDASFQDWVDAGYPTTQQPFTP
ncbi:MAG: rhodanese-like domain-containing protein [Deltaproteobacteria bacterium]|nr:rhodanese-like domain-containing protein [Deltaproteobacteria bacterium]